MNALAILQVIEALMKIAVSAGVNWNRYRQMKDLAESEGRELTKEELLEAIDEADDAIDRLEQAERP